MFRRTNNDVPEDVTFEPGLEKLGFKRNEAGQYVTIAKPHKFHQFDNYAKKNTNQRHYEAMHQAVREDVHAELGAHGIQPVWLFSADNDCEKVCRTGEENPNVPSVKILASSMDDIEDKKEIYLIIPDSKQELGIWSRKVTMTEGGIHAGTAVGLTQKLKNLAQDINGEDIVGEDEGQTFIIKGEDLTESETPGVVILNPGELLYSHQLKENMTTATWQHRQRKTGFSEAFRVREENKVYGHEDSKAHLKTFLDFYLDHFVKPGQRLSIIAVGDGGDAILQELNDRLYEIAGRALLDSITCIALVASTHNFDVVQAFELQHFLLHHGGAWEPSPEPKGTVLADVPPAIKTEIFAQAAKRRRDRPESEATYKFRTDVINYRMTDYPPEHLPPKHRKASALVSLAMAAAEAERAQVETMTSRVAKMRLEREEQEAEHDAKSDAQDYPVTSESPEFDHEFKFPAHVPDHINNKVDKSHLREFDDANSLHAGAARAAKIAPGSRGYITKRPEGSTPSLIDIGVSDIAATLAHTTSVSKPSNDLQPDTPTSSLMNIAKSSPQEEATGESGEAYAYYKEPKNCVTVSAGVEEVTQDILPATLDDVLWWLVKKTQLLKAHERREERIRDTEYV